MRDEDERRVSRSHSARRVLLLSTKMTTQFDRVYHGLSNEPGSAYFVSNLSYPASNIVFPLEFRVAASGMAWRGEDASAENVIAMSSTDIKWARWLRVARGFQLRVGLKDRRREGFEGFERDVSYCSSRSWFLFERWHSGP